MKRIFFACAIFCVCAPAFSANSHNIVIKNDTDVDIVAEQIMPGQCISRSDKTPKKMEISSGSERSFILNDSDNPLGETEEPGGYGCLKGARVVTWQIYNGKAENPYTCRLQYRNFYSPPLYGELFAWWYTTIAPLPSTRISGCGVGSQSGFIIDAKCFGVAGGSGEGVNCYDHPVLQNDVGPLQVGPYEVQITISNKLSKLRLAGKSGRQHSVELRNGGIHESNPQSRLHEGIP